MLFSTLGAQKRATDGVNMRDGEKKRHADHMQKGNWLMNGVGEASLK